MMVQLAECIQSRFFISMTKIIQIVIIVGIIPVSAQGRNTHANKSLSTINNMLILTYGKSQQTGLGVTQNILKDFRSNIYKNANT